jgi:hypothetical protein
MASAIGALVAAAVSLVMVAGSTAGNQRVPFQVFGAPTQVTAGDQGLVFAKFGPNGSGGSATHTVITFTFPFASVSAAPTADPATSADCGAAQLGLDSNQVQVYTITCNVGTVNPGATIKRFVTYQASPTTTAHAGITASVSYDAGSGASGGAANSDSGSAGVSIVDGGSTDGKCDGTSGTVQTTSLPDGALQQTFLNYQNASPGLHLPCSWGAVGVTTTDNAPPKPKPGAPLISTVAGPLYAGAAQLQITFSSLPVPLNKFVLEELDPTQLPNATWNVVPPCGIDPVSGAPTLPANADTCLIGYGKGKPIVANLLFAGTGGDPFYN